jgi:hypothetical protein
MSVSVYITGRNYDGTSFSPLYYSDASITNGQKQFLVPSGNFITVPLSSTTDGTADDCSSHTTPVYPFTGLYAFIEEETNRVIVTVQSTPDERFIPLTAGESFTSSNLALYFSSTASTLEPATPVSYNSSADSDGYLTVTTQANSNCASQNYISGTPIIANGIVYLIPQGTETSFYTAAVNGPSIYFIVSSSDYGTLSSDLKNALTPLPAGTPITSYIDTVVGVVPSPTQAISNSPSPPVSSPNYISPAQAAAVKMKAKSISTWIMIAAYIILAVIAIAAILIFVFTMRKYPDKPLLYNQKTQILTDIPSK